MMNTLTVYPQNLHLTKNLFLELLTRITKLHNVTAVSSDDGVVLPEGLADEIMDRLDAFVIKKNRRQIRS